MIKKIKMKFQYLPQIKSTFNELVTADFPCDRSIGITQFLTDQIDPWYLVYANQARRIQDKYQKDKEKYDQKIKELNDYEFELNFDEFKEHEFKDMKVKPLTLLVLNQMGLLEMSKKEKPIDTKDLTTMFEKDEKTL
jgi:hypothetical protein